MIPDAPVVRTIIGLRGSARALSKAAATHLIPLDKAPPVDIDNQTPDPRLLGTPQQIKPTHPLAKRLDDILGPALFLGRELRDEPGLLAVGVSTDEAVDDGRFPGFRVREVRTDGVDFNVLGCERSVGNGREGGERKAYRYRR